MSYAIGIDLGTTNTKAIAVEKDGSIILEMSQPTAVETVPTGGEMDPKQLAIGLLKLLKEMLAETGKLTDEPLQAISLTGMAEAGCLVDRRGDPLTPILLWYDRRGAEEAEELRAEHEDLLTSVSGIRMSSVATIYKLCRLKKDLPALSGQIMRWFGVPEWIAWILTGEHFTDRTLAVRTGAYSLKSDAWSPDILKITGLDRELFPEIIEAARQNIRISPEIADYFGLPYDVCIFIAGHDDMAAAFGAGLSEKTWVDSAGTAEGLVALSTVLPDTRKTVPSRMSVAPWYTPGQWALIAGVGTSGSMLSDLSRQTGLSFEAIDQLAEKREPCPGDALNTELTPQRLAKLDFAPGLTHEQKVSAVYARIMDNFSQRARQIGQFTDMPERLVITGGQARLHELNRRKSEVLGNIPIDARPEPEAAAYGAALLALHTPDP